jgi:hypothetical protein
MLKFMQRPIKINMTKDILNPQRFLTQIGRTPEVMTGMSRRPGEELTPEEVRARRIAALGNGASALARSKEKISATRLEANLFDIIANVNDFYEAQNSLDVFRNTHGATPLQEINSDEVDAFKADKQTITRFNHLILDVIDASAVTNPNEPNINFQDLVRFMTQQYAIISGEGNTAKFQAMARSTVLGMRNEFAVEQILIKNGVEFDSGNEKDDARGGDIIVNNMRIDLKASEDRAAAAQARAIENGYNPDRIIWSQIRSGDFRGELTLPPEAEERIAQDLIPLINRAAHTNYEALAS